MPTQASILSHAGEALLTKPCHSVQAILRNLPETIERISGEGNVRHYTNSQPEIDAYSKDLIGGLGCTASSGTGAFCTAVPGGTTVSVLFDVIANGELTTVSWGTTVAGLVGATRPIRLWRKHGSRMLPVLFESADPEALRLPLLPDDVLAFGR